MKRIFGNIFFATGFMLMLIFASATENNEFKNVVLGLLVSMGLMLIGKLLIDE